MQPGTHEFARTQFGLSWGTFVFYLLSCVTYLLLMFNWMWDFTNRVSSDMTRGTNKVLLILYYAFLPLSIFLPVSAVLMIVLSFRTRRELELMLAAHGMPQQLSGFLCFIFPFLYQYYVVYHAEERFYKAQMIRQGYAQAHPGVPYQQGAPYPGSYPQAGAQPSYPQQYAQAAPQPHIPAHNIPSPPPPAGVATAAAAMGAMAPGSPAAANPASGGLNLDANKIVSGAKKIYSAFNNTASGNDEASEAQVDENEADDEDDDDEE